MNEARRSWSGYVIGLLCVALLSVASEYLARSFEILPSAMLMLLSVLLIATRYGMKPAVFTSIAGVLYLNYFYIEPIHEINPPRAADVIALTTFVLVSIIVGELSSRAQQRAKEAEQARAEVERLYSELKLAFDKASQLEAIKRSELLKSALLDSVTHDFRTPLTSIKAAATTLRKGLSSEQVDEGFSRTNRQDLVDVIVEETDRLGTFVESLLVTARLKSGAVSQDETSGTVEEIISAAVQQARPLLRQHSLDHDSGEAVTELVPHARTVSQVLYALLDNAAKYSPPKSVIGVRVHSGDGTVTFTVEDEGPGIGLEEREKIFSRFYRRPTGDPNVAPQGLGMGLSIAAGLVEALGGRIWVDDKSERGARLMFTVPLPVRQTEEI